MNEEIQNMLNVHFNKPLLLGPHGNSYLKWSRIGLTPRLFKKSSKSGKKEATSGSFPLASVLYADSQFAAYEDLRAFRAVSDEGGLSLDCIKLALKVLLRNGLGTCQQLLLG